MGEETKSKSKNKSKSKMKTRMEEEDPNICQGRHAPRHALLPLGIPVAQGVDESEIEKPPLLRLSVLLLLLLLPLSPPYSTPIPRALPIITTWNSGRAWASHEPRHIVVAPISSAGQAFHAGGRCKERTKALRRRVDLSELNPFAVYLDWLLALARESVTLVDA
ncbi:hypothetical protein PISL3812_05223 [Talaromyces islandicus]|uniref:Uncharacterized protein n=1 Tax=Talaromyces islandicus TaxID=28573 RepID=A0A0U1LZ84_TALIS|nr:hypothetical protein PISL3812_05223 [Talaromyces islandicus]